MEKIVKDILKFPSGNIKRIGHKKSDKKHGQWVMFYESGLVHWVGNYLDGVEFGIWKEWYPSGSLCDECTYQEGIKIPINHWDSKGSMTLSNGTGWITEDFGSFGNDVYLFEYEKGLLIRESKLSGAEYGEFIKLIDK